MSKIKKEDYIVRRREQKKLSMRRTREKIYDIPEAHAEHNRRRREEYKENKKKGKIKGIADLTPRAQRAMKKSWRIRSKKFIYVKVIALILREPKQDHTE